MAAPVWDKTRPQSSEFGSNFPQECQQNWEYLEETLAKEHTFPGTIGPPQTAGAHAASAEGAVGMIEIATDAEVTTGTNDTKAVTPLKLATNQAAQLAAFESDLANAGQSSFYRLKIKNNASTPATKMDVSADRALLVGATTYLRVANVSVTIDFGVNGANGLDTGSISTGWYDRYIIAKADGTVAGLGCVKGATPVMPTDYVYKRLVGPQYYDTSAFRNVYQNGRLANYRDLQSAFTVSSASAVDETGSLTAFVPDNAVNIWGQINQTTPYSIASAFAWDAAFTTGKRDYLSPYAGLTFDGLQSSIDFYYHLNPAAPQTIYAKGADTNPRGIYCIGGYELDI